MRTLILCTFFSWSNLLVGQSILIKPYLQNASASSIYIMWETDTGDESTVEWGLDENLGNVTTGITYNSDNSGRIHEVQLTGLARLTHYYYRVKTDTSYSAIYKFKTPPFSSDGQDVRIVALSDMQKDNAHPRKFEEIINDGVIDYITQDGVDNITDVLDCIMIPGDLVVNGNSISQWRNDFFDQGAMIFGQIPFYPVLGNHENNAQLYFKYMKLPDNGSENFEEHWWYKDYSNIRIIGLNSNGPFNNQDQLDWLEELLNSTCSNDTTDFVFAQLHHPHKSELWTPGESDFTGEVISRLEQFSSACNKPSLHLFGHTHGYSRGQSRDHKHLWINVATAGGAIDNWGEFPNFDYDEFSVSQDEYGFVILEATNDEEPVLNIKRISRGDQDNIEDNIITDIITLSPKQENINSPSPLAPLNETLPPECVTLKASPFDGMHGEHGQSHWQVDVENSDFSNPIFESWKNFENWYFDVDTQAEDDLSDEVATALNPNTRYKWRVRYRDKAFNWSPWSEAASFETGPSIALPNLLSNPGAEYGLSDWTILEGVVEALPKDTCDGVAPFEGEYYFIVGGLCDHSSVARLIQEVEVTHFQDSIDGGDFRISFGGYLSNYGGLDQPEMKLIFLDADSNSLGESNSLTTLNNRWTPVEDQMSVPIGTRRIQLELMGTRNGGTDNDSYFDDLYLTLGREIIDCSTLTAVHELKPDLAAGKIIPNPNSGTFEIELPFEFDNSMQLFMMNSNGQKVQSDMTAEGKSLKIRSHNLTNGQYYLWITQNNVMRLYNKVVITP